MTSDFLSHIDKITELHATIDRLLEREDIADKHSDQKTGRWFIEELHSDNQVNVGIASSDAEGLTSFPLHRHPDSKEYLICVEGRVLLHIDSTVRILDAGDCACLPKGVAHYSKPLNGKARLIYVCVPSDKNFNRDDSNGRDNKRRITGNDSGNH